MEIKDACFVLHDVEELIVGGNAGQAPAHCREHSAPFVLETFVYFQLLSWLGMLGMLLDGL